MNNILIKMGIPYCIVSLRNAPDCSISSYTLAVDKQLPPNVAVRAEQHNNTATVINNAASHYKCTRIESRAPYFL
jgi:hypothetical protein